MDDRKLADDPVRSFTANDVPSTGTRPQPAIRTRLQRSEPSKRRRKDSRKHGRCPEVFQWRRPNSWLLPSLRFLLLTDFGIEFKASCRLQLLSPPNGRPASRGLNTRHSGKFAPEFSTLGWRARTDEPRRQDGFPLTAHRSPGGAPRSPTCRADRNTGRSPRGRFA